MFASLQSWGILLVCTDWLKSISKGRSRFGQFLKTFTLMASGPKALLALSLTSFFLMSSAVMAMSRRMKVGFSVEFLWEGWFKGGSSVSTEQKKAFNISALSWSWVNFFHWTQVHLWCWKISCYALCSSRTS